MHKLFFNRRNAGFHGTAGSARFSLAVLALVSAVCFLTAGCTCLSAAGQKAGTSVTGNGHGSRQLKLVSWNVETFFDASTEGCEYEEFVGYKSLWNADKYKDRLKRLADYMKDENADIYCFMEIENEAVVLDISNQLQGSDAHGTKWKYAAFGKEAGTAIGCAVFSKLPLESLTLHQIDYPVSLPSAAFEKRTAGTLLEPPVMRPLLEVRVNVAGSAPSSGGEPAAAAQDGTLVLFVCHWKSKSGNEAESAVWRNCQEALLTDRMQKALSKGAAVLACGDFNRGLSEFLWSYQEGFVELRGFSGTVPVESPWFASTQPGSYCYQGEWNKLDHIFTAGGTNLLSFRADTGGGLVKADGTPAGYSVATGKGYSDHLPLICTFTVSAQ